MLFISNYGHSQKIYPFTERLIELDHFIPLEQQKLDSLIAQRAIITSIQKELEIAINEGIKHQRIIDSLKTDNIQLLNLMKHYQNELIRLEEEEKVNQKRLKHIRQLYSIYPAINLPFTYQTQESLAITDIDTEDEIDTLIFGDDYPVSIIGIVPDSTKYFCFFYLIPAEDALPTVVTFNKNGGLISRKRLTDSCWQGCESDCRSIVTINPDLSIIFSYEEYLFVCEEDTFSNIPFEANGYIEYSKILETGECIVLKKIPKSTEELFQNPIIHTIIEEQEDK